MAEKEKRFLRISDEKTYELIELYQKEPCLWNNKLEAYRRKDKRFAAAERISRKLRIKNFDAYHVLLKFRNLRNSYCQELKKIAKSLNDETVYQPRVFWFAKMDSFLRPHLQPPANSTLFLLNESSQAGDTISDTNATDGESETTDELWIKTGNQQFELVEQHEKRGFMSTEDLEETSRVIQPRSPGEKQVTSTQTDVRVRCLPEVRLVRLPDKTPRRTEVQQQQIVIRPQRSPSPTPLSVHRAQCACSNQRQSHPPARDQSEQCQCISRSDQVLSQILTSLKTRHTDNDTYETFGRYVAAMLRSMPEERARALQPHIVALLASEPSADYNVVADPISID